MSEAFEVRYRCDSCGAEKTKRRTFEDLTGPPKGWRYALLRMAVGLACCDGCENILYRIDETNK